MKRTAWRSALRLSRSRRAHLGLALALLAGHASAEDLAPVVAQAAPTTEERPGDEPGETAAPAEPDPTDAEVVSDDASNVEVIHVRGRSAGAIETEVPASITQFDASTIQALGAQDISDLSRVTPNVNIVQPGATQATFFVRGIGLSDFSANSAGAVTIFQDDTALNAPAIQTGQLFDIRDVEIMRGPQGTGPYRNASGGAIRVASNLPSGNYGAQLRSSLGRYAAEGGKGAVRGRIRDFEGYLEAPIVTDWLASRFAFRLRDADPYQRNGCGNAIPFEQRLPKVNSPPLLEARDICGEREAAMWPSGQVSRIPVGLDDEVDIDDTWAARGFLRLRPPDTELDVVLNAHGSRLDEDQTFGQAIGTGRVPTRGIFFGGGVGQTGSGYQEPDQAQEFLELCGPSGAGCGALPLLAEKLAEVRPLDRKPYRGDYDRAGETTRDTWGGYLSAKYQLDDYEIFALGSVDAYERFRDQDTDFTPEILFEIVEFDEAWQTYEELHVAGELEATLLEWKIGGYALVEELDDSSITQLASENRIERAYSQNTLSFGPWAEFNWDFLDDVTLSGGVRWNWERKKFDISRRLLLGMSGSAQPSEAEVQKTWDTPTGNLILTYHFDEDASAFAKYTRGFKAGHFNASASDDLRGAAPPHTLYTPPANPEYNDAWEAGLAGAWFDRRLSGMLSYFYYRYQDYQVFLFRTVALEPPVLEIVNAAEAENYGIEVEGRVAPLRGWVPHFMEDLQLSANFGWLHGEFLDFQLRNTLSIAGETIPITMDFSGDQLLNSPEFKVAGSVVWTFDLGRWGFLIPRYDFNWTDDVFFGLNEGRGTGLADLQGSPKLPEFAVGQKAYWLHNVRLAYRTPPGNVELAVFVRNLEDEVYKNYAFDASDFSNLVLNFVGQPRTIGLDVVVTF